MASQDPSDLLQAYLDGALAAPDEQALETRLKGDPLLADWLLLLATEEAVLREWAGTATVALRTTDAGDGLAGEYDLVDEAGPAPGSEAPATDAARRTLRRRLAIGGGVVAVLAVVAAIVLWPLGGWQYISPSPTGPAQDPIAVLEHVYGDVTLFSVYDEEFMGKSGQTLKPDEKIQTGASFGLATVRYPDGVCLELTTDTIIVLVSEGEGVVKHVELQKGFLMAEVPKQADGQPWVLTTPHAEITVLKARFSCLSTPQTTIVEVEEGRVEMVRLSGARPVSGEPAVKVEKGSYAVAGKEAEALAAHPLKPLQIDKPRKVLSDPAAPVLVVIYRPDGKALASGSWDGTVRIWGPRTGEETARPRDQKPPVRCLAFFPNNELLAIGGDRDVRIWDVPTEQEAPPLPGHQNDVNGLAIAPNGKWVATANVERSESSAIKILAWPVGGDVLELKEHSGTAPCLAFAPDSQKLAAGFQDGRVKIVEVPSRKKLAAFQAHAGSALAVQFSPQGDLLATAGQDMVAKLWKWKEAKPAQVFTGHAREVRALAFSPDGRFLATGATDGTARLWEVGTGQEVATFKHRGYAVTSVAFAPDGKTLATAGWNKTIKLWDVPELPPVEKPEP